MFTSLFQAYLRKTQNAVQRPRILLIDDDVVFGKIMASWAKRSNLSLRHWSSLQKKNSLDLAQYDVIILDYELENITGFQFAQQLCNYLTGTPILLVSSYPKMDESSWPLPVSQFMGKNEGPEKILMAALKLHQDSGKEANLPKS